MQPRLDNSKPGWLVVGPQDAAEISGKGWCLIVDGDTSVEVRRAEEHLTDAERNALGLLADLAKTGVVDTLGSTASVTAETLG